MEGEGISEYRDRTNRLKEEEGCSFLARFRMVISVLEISTLNRKSVRS